MKFSGKISLKIILKVRKNQGFSLSLEDMLFEKPPGEDLKLTPPPVSRFRVKVPLIKSFIKANNIDISFLSETFLASTIPLDDARLHIKGYSMIRADHPIIKKRGGVFIKSTVNSLINGHAD